MYRSEVGPIQGRTNPKLDRFKIGPIQSWPTQFEIDPKSPNPTWLFTLCVTKFICSEFKSSKILSLRNTNDSLWCHYVTIYYHYYVIMTSLWRHGKCSHNSSNVPINRTSVSQVQTTIHAFTWLWRHQQNDIIETSLMTSSQVTSPLPIVTSFFFFLYRLSSHSLLYSRSISFSQE